MAETEGEFVPSPELLALRDGAATALLAVDEFNKLQNIANPLPSIRARRDLLATMICDSMGLTPLIKAIGPGGVLRPPPEWPEVDLVPIAFNFEHKIIGVDVRTFHNGKVHRVRSAIRTMEKSQLAAHGEEALDRGRHELRKRFKKMR